MSFAPEVFVCILLAMVLASIVIERVVPALLQLLCRVCGCRAGPASPTGAGMPAQRPGVPPSRGRGAPSADQRARAGATLAYMARSESSCLACTMAGTILRCLAVALVATALCGLSL